MFLDLLAAGFFLVHTTCMSTLFRFMDLYMSSLPSHSWPSLFSFPHKTLFSHHYYNSTRVNTHSSHFSMSQA